MKSTKPGTLVWVSLFSSILVASKAVCAIWVSPLAWGINFGTYLPSYYLLLYAVASLAFILLARYGVIEQIVTVGAGFMEKWPRIFQASAVAIFWFMAFSFRVKAPLLGDSFVLVNNYVNTFVGGHDLSIIREPLALEYFYGMMNLLGVTMYPAVTLGFFVGELVLSAVFVLAVYGIIIEIITGAKERYLLFVFSLLLPSSQLFFGYVEVYSVVLVALILFLLMTSRFINGKSPFILVCLSYYLLVSTHVLAVVVLPAMVYLVWLELKRGKWRNVLFGLGIGAVALLILLLQGTELLNRIFPGDDHTHYLSLFAVDDGYQAYTLFSPYHFTDLANLVLLVCPFAVLFLIGALFINRTLLVNSPLKIFLLLASLGVGGFIFTAKFDLGLPVDWDVSVPWLFLVQFYLAVVFLQLDTHDKTKSFFLIVLVVAAHSLLWFGLNSTIRPNYDRVQALRDNRILPQGADFLTTMHLSRYNYVNSNLKGSIGLWEDFTNRYPDYARGYSHLVSVYADSRGEDPAKIESAILRWRKIAPDDENCKQSYLTFYFGLAQNNERVGNLDKADEYYKKVFLADSLSPQTLNNVGGFYAKHARWAEAYPLFLKAIAMDSNYTHAYENLGIYCLQTRDLPRAIAMFNTVIKKDSMYIDAYKRLVLAYRYVGMNDKATEVFNKGAEMQKRKTERGVP